jgi:exodeoxyribonuclease VII small subunit
MSKARTADGPSDDIGNLSFEEAVKKLESIVDAMDSQELPLESLLARYEEGAILVRLCQEKLNAAGLKIQQLEKNAQGSIVAKPAAFEEQSMEHE